MTTLFRSSLGLCLTLSCPLPAQSVPAPVALADLVPPGHPLKQQDLRFDARHASLALAYVQSGDPALVPAMAGQPAIEHLLRHARRFGYDVPKNSPEALAAHLVQVAPERHAAVTAVAAQSLAYFTGPMLRDPAWVSDVLRYLPRDFRFHGTLFLTFNYDIGVAEGATASLNAGHRFFQAQPRELVYYAIHELHHTGYMTYHTIAPIAQWKTQAHLLNWVEYATQLEGMAVWAAYARRQAEGALAQDGMGDYVALDDPARMQSMEAEYQRGCQALKARGDQPASPQDLEALFALFSKDRLWYRVGAHMARRIEAVRGRAFLVDLIKAGPGAFQKAYRSLNPAVPLGASGTPVNHLPQE